MKHSFNVKLAEKYGINNAVIINSIATKIIEQKNDQIWTYWDVNLSSVWPYFDKRQIEKVLRKLTNLRIIQIAYIRTYMFAIIDKEILDIYSIAEGK